MTSNDIPPMLKVMKIVMTKSYFRRLWWERKISSYRNQLEIDLLEAREKVNKKAIVEIKRKIEACNKWLKRFSLDLGNLKDAQLEVVFDIIDKHHQRHKYQREIKRLGRRIEQVEKTGKKDPQIYDVKSLKHASEELLERHVA